MTMTKRRYLALIQQSVKEDGVSFEEVSPDYLYRAIFGKEQNSFIMHDVEIGLNNASAAKTAMSKSGTYATMKHANIASVEHFFIMNSHSRFNCSDSIELAKNLFYKWGENVVLKQDDGSQGSNVYKINNVTELEERLTYLFSIQTNASLSPFYEATYEYRVVTLLGEPKIFLAKERTNSWKHNLVSGAVSIDVDEEKIPLLSDIARKAASAIELDFCTIDILETSGGLLVLEINEQVMLDEFCKNNKTREEKVSRVYREAILERFSRQKKRRSL